MAEYKTKQKETIQLFLEKNKDKCYTVDDLLNELMKKGGQIGRTTVYRTLKELKEKETVREFLSARGEATFYQYAEKNECSHHLHLMCTGCGEVFHLDCECNTELEEHFLNHHDFLIDNTKTVIYGKCAKCRGEIQ